MTESRGRISAKVSLEGAKDLYLIIVGIGITEALMHTGDFKRLSEFFPYLILLAGYLLTVFRFSVGMINMLSHVAERVHNHWTRVVSFVALTFLATGLCFFWMGNSLQNTPVFIFNTMLLLFSGWATLFVSHRPWAFPRGWGWWMLGKALAIWFNYPRGIYDPHQDTQRYPPLTPEEVTVKSTHYQWIRSNFWLMLVLLATEFAWPRITAGVPSMVEAAGFELWLGIVLTAFAVWDFKVNKAYYFGDDNDWGQPNM